MGARKSPEINSGSMADISFLLLTFFLLTSSINTDLGITRKLPPPLDPNAPVPPPIKERNVFVVLVNSRNDLMVEGRPMNVKDLKKATKDFLANPNEDPNLSEKTSKTIDLIGEYNVSKGVISLQNDRGTSYEMYIKVQNELLAAINELRNELSKQKFSTDFVKLNDKMQDAIKDAIPVSISEAEPKDIGGTK